MTKRVGVMSDLEPASQVAGQVDTATITSEIGGKTEEQLKKIEGSIKSFKSNKLSKMKKKRLPSEGELSSVFKLTPLSMIMNNKVSSSSMPSNNHMHRHQSQQNLLNRGVQQFNLPVASRRVRDSASLLLMLCFLGFLSYVIWDGVVVKESNIDLIVHGYDSHGNICGYNNKPIKFVEKSGKNFSSKPYTKYTLINAYFERYELISDRLTSPNDIYYVKNNLDLAKIRSELRESDKDQSKTGTGSRAQNARSLLATLEQLNRQRSNRTALNMLKSSLMYQYPPSYQSLDKHKATFQPSSPSSKGEVNGLPEVARIQRNKNQSQNSQAQLRNDLVTSQSIAHQAQVNLTSNRYSSTIDTSLVNDTALDENYDHVFVNRSSIGRNKPRIPDIIGHDEVQNQLFYLTECVDSCPNDHLELIFYRCIPKNWRFTLFPNAINVTRTFIDDIISDIGHCYREFIYIFSFALVLSLTLLILLRFLATFIIWSCLALIITLLISTATYSWLNFYHLIIDLNDIGPQDSIYLERVAATDKWLVGSIFLTFIALAIIVAVIFMRKRILLVTKLFRESGKAIADMPLLLLQPLLTFATLVLIITAWSIALICLQSVKVPVIDRTTGFVVYKAETFYKVMKWYHAFAFLWMSHFALACQHYVIGASVSKWYFTTDRYNLHSPIGSSVSELILYYMGSVALGSFLVTIFKVIRILTRQIQYLIQRNCVSPTSNHNSTSLSSHSEALSPPLSSSCCGSLSYVWRLFIWFFDKIVMIISHDAYVEISIHGYSFIGGAQRAFTVLASNPLRLLAIKTVSNLLLTVTKICVVFGTISMAMLLVEEKSTQLNYSWSPIIISAIYAYIVAHWFLSVYEMVIDALFICYCEDYERSKLQDQVIYGMNNQTLMGSNFMSQILRENSNTVNDVNCN